MVVLLSACADISNSTAKNRTARLLYNARIHPYSHRFTWQSSRSALSKKLGFSQAWWCTPILPALRRLRQEDWKFKDSLGYITRPCLKKKEGRV
jgi:hypothetical protein